MMPSSHRDLSQDLVDALGLATERETLSGGLWCSLECGKALRKAVLVRGKALNGILMQAMRLMRLMEHADPKGYAAFLYLKLPALSKTAFAHNLGKAIAAGRLNAIVEPAGEDKLRFLESEMAVGDQAFDLTFGRMPLIGAFIDAVHNMLGFDHVAQCCADILGPDCLRPASGVANDLKRELLDWLKPRMARDHHERQAALIRGYLVGAGKTRHADIDDETVLDFWVFCGSRQTEIDGFRLFRNATRHVLAYRSSLRVVETEREALRAKSVSMGYEDAESGGIDLDRLAVGGDDDADWAAPLFDQVNDDWVSPLETLATSPCDRIKWIFKDDAKILRHLVGEEHSPDESDRALRVAASVFADEPPNPAFYRTVLRFSCFGAMQLMVSRTGNGKETSSDLDDYANLAEWHRKKADDILKAAAAAAFSLIHRGDPAGLALALYIDPKRTGAALQEMPDTGNIVSLTGDQLAPTARLPGASGRAILETLEKYYKKVERDGFKQSQITDPVVGEGLAAGASAIETLHTHVRQYVDWCGHQDLSVIFEEDLAIFKARFEEMYGIGYGG